MHDDIYLSILLEECVSTGDVFNWKILKIQSNKKNTQSKQRKWFLLNHIESSSYMGYCGSLRKYCMFFSEQEGTLLF